MNERYDAGDGTAIGDTPSFEDPTPEQKEHLEKVKADLMAMFSGQKQKKGCAGSAALFLVSIGTLAWAVARQVGGGE